MMKRRKSRVQFLFVARLALAFCSAMLVAQVRSNAKSDFMQAPTPVTLWMEWQRGDPHYSSNFILLHTPCQNSEDGACQCQLSFKVINSEEFADYVSSFGDTKIPVMYEVVYGPDGSPRGTRLASVGTWGAGKFPANDRLLGVQFESKSGVPNTPQKLKLHTSAGCFPKNAPGSAKVTSQDYSQGSKASATSQQAPQEEQSQRLTPLTIPQKVAQSMLINKVQPAYPQDARDKHIQGTVILNTRISKEGKVTRVAVVSGHPLLAPAAVDAVKRWTYKPYTVNGKPIAVETRADLDFKLPQN